MKRFACLLLTLALVCAALAGCKKAEEKETTSAATESVPETTEAAKPVSLYDLSRAMLAAAEFGEMRYVSNTDDEAAEEFEYLSDLDYELVDSWFLSYAADGKGNADEVAVVRVRDAADLDKAVSSLQAHLEKRIALYKTYDPSQSEKVGKGLVFSEAGYAVLIVSGDNRAIRSAFQDFLAKQ